MTRRPTILPPQDEPPQDEPPNLVMILFGVWCFALGAVTVSIVAELHWLLP